jgi:hypothetical protein
MHDHLWAGVEQRLRNARNTLDEARKVLQRPTPPVQSLVQESAGAMIAAAARAISQTEHGSNSLTDPPS